MPTKMEPSRPHHTAEVVHHGRNHRHGARDGVGVEAELEHGNDERELVGFDKSFDSWRDARLCRRQRSMAPVPYFRTSLRIL